MPVTLPPFQALLDEHAPDLHRFLVASAGPHDGADCFQETVIAALRAYPGLRHADNLRGWLFTIAHHKVVDQARARQRRALPVADVAEMPVREARGDGLAGGGGVVDDMADTVVDGLADAELLTAVHELPPKQRSAVVQRYLLDRPYAEVATVIGCSEEAARQNVRAGLQRLRQSLRDDLRQEVTL